MSTHFKSGPAFGLSAEVKSKVRSALIDSCQRCAGARALLQSGSLRRRLFGIGGIFGVFIFQCVLWEGYGDLIQCKIDLKSKQKVKEKSFLTVNATLFIHK